MHSPQDTIAAYYSISNSTRPLKKQPSENTSLKNGEEKKKKNL